MQGIRWQRWLASASVSTSEGQMRPSCHRLSLSGAEGWMTRESTSLGGV